jgi:hypothetical protein
MSLRTSASSLAARPTIAPEHVTLTRAAIIAGCLCFAAGCAGGTPLLHPAQPLRAGQSRFGAGTSGTFAVGATADALATARATNIPAAVDRPPPDYVRGALVAAAVAPGMAPFVSGRVGAGRDTEAGLSYTGRTARLDARYAPINGPAALSVGLGASAILGHRGGSTSSQLDHLVLDGLSGWGADIPVIFGLTSDADVLWWWVGARAGYESLRGSVAYEVPAPATGGAATSISGDVEGRRMWASALTGIAIGFRHVHAGIELQGTYHDARGKLWGTDVTANGLSVTPAAALLGSF